MGVCLGACNKDNSSGQELVASEKRQILNEIDK